jgi:hypothetical protein
MYVIIYLIPLSNMQEYVKYLLQMFICIKSNHLFLIEKFGIDIIEKINISNYLPLFTWNEYSVISLHNMLLNVQYW